MSLLRIFPESWNRRREPTSAPVEGDVTPPAARKAPKRNILAYVLGIVLFIVVLFLMWSTYKDFSSEMSPAEENVRRAGSFIFGGGSSYRLPEEGERASLPKEEAPKPQAPLVNPGPVAGTGGTPIPIVPNAPGSPGSSAPNQVLPPGTVQQRQQRFEGDPRVASRSAVPGGDLVSSRDMGDSGLVSSRLREGVQGHGRGGTELERMLQVTSSPPAVARTIKDTHRYIMAGELLGTCVMQTKFVSDVPSGIACQIGTPIYGKGGHEVLFPAGSVVVGEVSASVAEGRERVFGVAAKMRTPACSSPPYEVQVVDLNSPFTGPLGEGGLGGQVNTHFWKRLGYAIPVGLARSTNLVFTAGSGSSSQGQSVIMSNVGGQAGSVMQQEAQRGLQIPPTITINQGEIISVFAMRDLYIPERRCSDGN